MYMQQEVLIFAFIAANLTYEREVSVAFIITVYCHLLNFQYAPRTYSYKCRGF